jgi:hypothetical protein
MIARSVNLDNSPDAGEVAVVRNVDRLSRDERRDCANLNPVDLGVIAGWIELWCDLLREEFSDQTLLFLVLDACEQFRAQEFDRLGSIKR